MDEAPLALEGRVESGEHRVECVGKLTELVVGAAQVYPAREIGRLDLARDAGYATDRTQHAAGDDPARAEAADEEQSQRGEGVLTELRERPGVDRALELLGRDGHPLDDLTVRRGEELAVLRPLRDRLRVQRARDAGVDAEHHEGGETEEHDRVEDGEPHADGAHPWG